MTRTKEYAQIGQATRDGDVRDATGYGYRMKKKENKSGEATVGEITVEEIVVTSGLRGLLGTVVAGTFVFGETSAG